MASTIEHVAVTKHGSNFDYPTRDGRPMAETDLHRDMMFELIAALRDYYAGQAVYVTGNLLVFYEPGNKRRHISPDCMVVKGVGQLTRPNYLIWEEGRSADVVVEVTSKTTRKEDIQKKFEIYRTIMRVREYFLFDPTGDYLSPRLRGYRLIEDQYVPTEPTGGRLFSEELGLFLAAREVPDWRLRVESNWKIKGEVQQLRLYDPVADRWLPTIAESVQIERQRADQAEEARQQADEENDRLKRELAELRRRMGGDA